MSTGYCHEMLKILYTFCLLYRKTILTECPGKTPIQEGLWSLGKLLLFVFTLVRSTVLYFCSRGPSISIRVWNVGLHCRDYELRPALAHEADKFDLFSHNLWQESLAARLNYIVVISMICVFFMSPEPEHLLLIMCETRAFTQLPDHSQRVGKTH